MITFNAGRCDYEATDYLGGVECSEKFDLSYFKGELGASHKCFEKNDVRLTLWLL